jgi:hypothetical protein
MALYRKRYPVVTLGMPPEGFAGVMQPAMGETYFVDPVNGSDGKRGTDINHPLLTLEQAVEKATDGQGDIINCFPGTHDIESTDGLVLEKEGLTIQAMDYGMNRHGGGMGEKFTIRNAAAVTDKPAITIKQPCKIIGMGITTRNTSGPSLLFDCEETGAFNAGFSHILNCRFSAWYGAIDSFIHMIGGQQNRIEGCAFDGLFGGITTAGILLDSDTGPIDVGFTQIIGNYFYGMGSSKPAIKIASSDTATGLLVAHNYLSAGFVSANQGVLIDLNSTDSFGLIADNWVAPLANQAAAMLNTGSWTGGFADNHYEET